MRTGIFRRYTKRFFVYFNIVIAVSFLLGCYCSWFNPAYFWFVGLLTLASLYLLLILVLFIIFWLIFKTKFAFISIAAILLAWNPVRQLIKFRFSTEDMTAKAPADIRVMSWNVEHFDILEHKKHPEVKEKMIALINKYEPDIACFQEMVASDFDSTAINYVPQFLKELHFSQYNYSYNKKLDFDGKHRFGIITFSKFPIVRQHTISYDPNDYNSIFQYTDIQKGADTFRIFNVHLQSLKFSNVNRQYMDDPTIENGSDLKKSKNIIVKLKTGFLKRRLQSDRIRKAVNESLYPVIICGDFNDVPNSYAYDIIGKNLKNAFVEKGGGIGRTFSAISPTLRIDNILCDKLFGVKQFVRINKKMSDHFPIITDLQIGNSNK